MKPEHIRIIGNTIFYTFFILAVIIYLMQWDFLGTFQAVFIGFEIFGLCLKIACKLIDRSEKK